MRAAPNLHASVHVKLFEDVTNHDQLRATKAPPPAHRALAELERQQRLQQAVLRQRANPAVPRYAQPLGVRPQTAPSGRPTLLRGPPGATGYAAVSRPSQRVGGERAYLPVTKAPNKAPTDSYALSPHKANPRLGEVEKEMLHRQALLRRLMREPRHAAHGVARPQSRPQSAHPQSRPQSAHPQSRPQSAHPQSRPPSAPCSSRPAYVGSPDMYRHERTLGKGAFGLVSLVRSVRTGTPTRRRSTGCTLVCERRLQAHAKPHTNPNPNPNPNPSPNPNPNPDAAVRSRFSRASSWR